MLTMNLYLADESATLALGADIAKHCPKEQFTLHLEGDLGAGKTTFTRGLLRQLGHQGNVKSPTYTLVEQYQLADRAIFHFDLYRVSDPEELDYLGLDDYLSGQSLCIIEWASQGGSYLPKADLVITFSYQEHARNVELTALSESAIQLCKQLKR
ncbi:MAG: tRNA (adenosine(37)-N6)-threonylcarbamoyltransferase complex ATPase subunit type 1 TsaE [Gammaproteobacteria bacterium]|nr:MAG: tRNA (adenosine(37)-N6)-threonylcarbamoyltransferase complex ATPase subunit type 1 TsaE [Gammaproteobacteria bacterium]